MDIRIMKTDTSKKFQNGGEALVDLGFKKVGNAVITTNDGHEVKEIFKKDEESVYIIYVDHSDTTINSLTICTIKDSEYLLIED